MLFGVGLDFLSWRNKHMLTKERLFMHNIYFNTRCSHILDHGLYGHHF